MFDGVLRPLEQIKTISGGIYIPRGLDVPALPRNILWDFVPSTSIKVENLRSRAQLMLHYFAGGFPGHIWHHHRYSQGK